MADQFTVLNTVFAPQSNFNIVNELTLPTHQFDAVFDHSVLGCRQNTVLLVIGVANLIAVSGLAVFIACCQLLVAPWHVGSA